MKEEAGDNSCMVLLVTTKQNKAKEPFLVAV